MPILHPLPCPPSLPPLPPSSSPPPLTFTSSAPSEESSPFLLPSVPSVLAKLSLFAVSLFTHIYRVRLCAVVLLVGSLCVVVASIMWARGKLYRNAIAHCQGVTDGFCGLATPQLALPEALRQEVLHFLDQTDADPRLAVRALIPGVRAGRTVLSHSIVQLLPSVVRWYERLSGEMSDILGVPVQPTSLSLPTSCSLVIYDRAGDGIEWHYDVNYFTGRFFTLLVPVTSEPTCTRFAYRDAFGGERSVDLQSAEYAGRSIAFEGDDVYHMATPLCAAQRRVVLSLQFSTDPSLTTWNRFMTFVKDRAFTGLGLGF